MAQKAANRKPEMKRKLKMWFARWFLVITKDQAIEWGLVHSYNIYGDEINAFNCRSIWLDSKRRVYRIEELA